jgi:prepilin-type N-terminal cleavage/methylation domain-containing protein
MRIFKINLLTKGFSLVEMMVVVAVIGILSAVAVPTFKKFIMKSRKTEAKIALSGIFTAEQSLFADYSTFATCLTVGGFDPGPANARLYQAGFNAQPGDVEWGNKIVNKAVPCAYNGPATIEGIEYFNPTKILGSYSDNPCNIPSSGCLAGVATLAGTSAEVSSATTFLAAAGGTLEPWVNESSSQISLNGFTIDQNKKVNEYNNPNFGLP